MTWMPRFGGFALVLGVAATVAMEAIAIAPVSVRASEDVQSTSPSEPMSSQELDRLAVVVWRGAVRVRTGAADLRDQDSIERDRRLSVRVPRMLRLPSPNAHSDEVLTLLEGIVGLSDAQRDAVAVDFDTALASEFAAHEQRMIAAFRRAVRQFAIESGAAEGDHDPTEIGVAFEQIASASEQHAAAVGTWIRSLGEQCSERQRTRLPLVAHHVEQGIRSDGAMLRTRTEFRYDPMLWVAKQLSAAARPFPADPTLCAALESLLVQRNGSLERARNAHRRMMVASMRRLDVVARGEDVPDRLMSDLLASTTEVGRAKTKIGEVDRQIAAVMFTSLERQDRMALARYRDEMLHPDAADQRPAAWDELWHRLVEAVGQLESPAERNRLLALLDAHADGIEDVWNQFTELVERVNGRTSFRPSDAEQIRRDCQRIADRLAAVHERALTSLSDMQTWIGDEARQSSWPAEALAAARDAATRAVADGTVTRAKYRHLAKTGDLEWVRWGLLRNFVDIASATGSERTGVEEPGGHD